MLQPVESVFSPISKAVEGHFIPGVLVRYPVRTVNYADYTSALRRSLTKDPVTKFPGMNEDHGKGSSIMEKLKAALNLKPGDDPRHSEFSKKDPRFETFRQGYQRMIEDLGWRGVHRVAVAPPMLGGLPMPGGPPMPGAAAGPVAPPGLG